MMQFLFNFLNIQSLLNSMILNLPGFDFGKGEYLCLKSCYLTQHFGFASYVTIMSRKFYTASSLAKMYRIDIYTKKENYAKQQRICN